MTKEKRKKDDVPSLGSKEQFPTWHILLRSFLRQKDKGQFKLLEKVTKEAQQKDLQTPTKPGVSLTSPTYTIRRRGQKKTEVSGEEDDEEDNNDDIDVDH
jgi:hypothetical protein